jgi:hypothetical protein
LKSFSVLWYNGNIESRKENTNKRGGTMGTITELNTETIQQFTISELAQICRADWTKKINFAARPYLEALLSVDSKTIVGSIGYDSVQGTVLYFLTNAGSWRGDVAKLVKGELKRRLRLNGYKI